MHFGLLLNQTRKNKGGGVFCCGQKEYSKQPRFIARNVGQPDEQCNCCLCTSFLGQLRALPVEYYHTFFLSYSCCKKTFNLKTSKNGFSLFLPSTFDRQKVLKGNRQITRIHEKIYKMKEIAQTHFSIGLLPSRFQSVTTQIYG